jgi:hypothetical protein
MSELTVSISDRGEVKVFVDGLQVGLIQELTVRAAVDRPMPAVEVRLPKSSIIEASGEAVRDAHKGYLELLRRIPSVVLMSGDEPTGTDSEVILYFLDQAVDGGGRTLTQVMQKDNSWFERAHDYIQWMLPTRRRSKYEPSAPVLTDRDIQVFQVRRDLREAYSFGVDRVKRFLELDQMCPVWVRRKDHNHKRISRLIESLMDLGFEERARRVLEQVLRIERANPDIIDPEAVEHWKQACAR